MGHLGKIPVLNVGLRRFGRDILSPVQQLVAAAAIFGALTDRRSAAAFLFQLSFVVALTVSEAKR